MITYPAWGVRNLPTMAPKASSIRSFDSMTIASFFVDNWSTDNESHRKG